MLFNGAHRLSFCVVWRFALVFGLFLGVFSSQSVGFASQTESATPPIAFAARVIGDANRSRLIVDFDKDVTHDAYLLDDPKRIVIDLPETIFSLDGELKRLPKSLVSDLRYGTIAPGQSRIVLELAEPVVIENHRVRELSDEKRHRLIVDLTKSTNSEFAKAVRKTVIHKKSAAKSVAKDPSKFTIVIDPGHGGIDGGASGANKTREKTVTFAFAQKLKAKLAAVPNYNVVMTREGDDFVRLTERVEIARQNKADLLISVHADSLQQKHIRGATIYTLSKEGSDDISRALAQKQNRSDLIAGLSLPEEKEEVSDILIEMTRRETEAFSRRFASLIVHKMQKDVKLIRNPHRSADFYVLKAPEIPSVLLELGYLSNKEDEALLNSADWRDKAVQRTFDAIQLFFRSRIGIR